MPMTHTQKTLERARYWLGKAKASANEYEDFTNNMDSFITKLNSVNDVMINEFGGVPNFPEWHDKKEKELFAMPLVKLFREERRLTEHIKPFEAGVDNNSLYTDIQEPFIVRGGATVGFPMIKDEKGNTRPDDESPILVDGKPVKVKRKTSIKYYFIDRPKENAILLSDAYFNLISDVVTECHEKFKPKEKRKMG